MAEQDLTFFQDPWHKKDVSMTGKGWCGGEGRGPAIACVAIWRRVFNVKGRQRVRE